MVKLDDLEIIPDGAEVDYKQVGDDVPKGLDRIDQVGLPLDGAYVYSDSGKNVTVYILDTGIKLDHIDFQGRATCALDTFRKYIKNDFFEPFDDDFFDGIVPLPYCNDTANHGTHVAGIIGGILSGVAKKTNIVSVKVISKSGGTASSILAGLEYVRLQKLGFPSKPMVVNMSLGSLYSKSVNRAADRLVDAGVVVVAAAGNRGINACLVSPASSKRVITVGAATTTERLFENRDRRTLYSNWGRCVDIFA
jgi:subtilisin family serine protease